MRKEYDTIIELEDEFVRKSGGTTFHHKKVYSDEKLYIYQIDNAWYEIFRRNIKPKTTYVNGEYIELEGVGRAVYPTDNNFGYWAWSCNKNSLKTILEEKFGYDSTRTEAIFAYFLC